jgi:Zn-dependent peptidase ImmA (M78 family)/transcriptional regulator with XRE-family HTH domain
MEREVGDRIRRIREAAGIQAQELAARVDLDPTALSKIENGRRSVKSTELARIADALRVSPLALLEDNPLLSSLPVAARRNNPNDAIGEVYDRLLGLSELHVVLADGGIPTSPLWASAPSASELNGLNWREGANRLADWAAKALPTRAYGDQRLAALADVIEQQLKIDVLIDSYPNDSIAGAAVTHETFPLLFVNSAYPRTRCLFTLAHELGHVMARHTDETITFDRDMSGSTDSERMANAFASNYLMPAEVIASAIEERGRQLATLMQLTYRLGVSFQSLVYRLHNLGYINAEGRDRLDAISWQQLSSRLSDPQLASGLTRTEIAKLQLRATSKPAGRPPAVLLGRAFEGFRKGVISVRPLADLMGEDPDELLDRLGDERRYQDDVATVQSHFPGQEGAESEEELFDGSPV